ncbi:MAG TPA: hypothetical protein VHD37_02655 [Candidatus Paceibacterota bacterium]|nr:hypothetical protein [Candidatus Paceibacterota bacterium]
MRFGNYVQIAAAAVIVVGVIVGAQYLDKHAPKERVADRHEVTCGLDVTTYLTLGIPMTTCR